MEQLNLFELDESLSPYLTWIQKYKIKSKTLKDDAILVSNNSFCDIIVFPVFSEPAKEWAIENHIDLSDYENKSDFDKFSIDYSLTFKDLNAGSFISYSEKYKHIGCGTTKEDSILDFSKHNNLKFYNEE